MRRFVGLGIAAVVLSVTLGVLIGLVIHTGMAARSGGVLPSTAGDEVAASSAIQGAGLGGVPSGTSGASSIAGDTSPSSADWTLVTAVTSPGNPAAATATADPAGQPSGAAAATSPVPPSGSSSTGGTTMGTTASTTASTTATTAPPITPRPGSDVPDGPCSTLGGKSSTAGGATLFCQRDQGDRSLRWRVVTDGGGCLNQAMTGTGVDGRLYRCQLGPGGLNHWEPAG